nr:calcium-binding protein [Nostoc linckia FACHB-104]
TGTSKNDSLEGGIGNDTILGGAGDDSINGGGGNDSLDGGAGSDRLILNLSTQTSNLNLALSNNLTVAGVTAKNFEQFTITTGSGNDSITQPTIVNSAIYRSNDSFTTGAGNDTINAGLGSDTVNGGVGDDLLILDYSIDDVGKEMRLNTSSSNGESYGSAYRYQAATNTYLDYLSFSGINRLQVTGTSKNDSLEGGIGNDTILGGAGDDSINGGGGNDSLDGGAGNDILIGGLGNDTLIGGNGTDRFSFNNGNQGIDIIIDFLSNQGDKISVSASGFGGGLVAGGTITTDQFVIGTAAGDASDRFIYNSANGDLLFDIDGTGALAATQIAVLSSKPSLAYSDIVVIA